jgi:hypothetical protein
MTAWYFKNLPLLAERSPGLSSLLKDYPPVQTEEGTITIRGLQKPFHFGDALLIPGPKNLPLLRLSGPPPISLSGRDPQKEDQALLQKFLSTLVGAPFPPEVTVFGLGLAFLPEELLLKGSSVWVYEPYLPLISAALSSRDLSSLLLNTKCYLFSSDQSLPPETPQTLLPRPLNYKIMGDSYPL